MWFPREDSDDEQAVEVGEAEWAVELGCQDSLRRAELVDEEVVDHSYV